MISGICPAGVSGRLLSCLGLCCWDPKCSFNTNNKKKNNDTNNDNDTTSNHSSGNRSITISINTSLVRVNIVQY